MTDTQELRRLLAAATKGTWQQGVLLDTQQTRGWTEHVRKHGEAEEARRIFVGMTAHDQGRGRKPVAEFQTADDAALIIAAVNALPKLLDRVEKAEKERSDALMAADRFQRRAEKAEALLAAQVDFSRRAVDRIAVLERAFNPGATHYADCWKHHDSCALVREYKALAADPSSLKEGEER